MLTYSTNQITEGSCQALLGNVCIQNRQRYIMSVYHGNSFIIKDAALSLIGASLSETHLLRCMAEVPVAMYVCMFVIRMLPGKFLLCLSTTILYAIVCTSQWCVHVVSLPQLDRPAQLSGTRCRIWARAHFKGAA